MDIPYLSLTGPEGWGGRYNLGTDRYDSSDKNRTPSWCDRIFLRGDGCSVVSPSSYTAHDALTLRRSQSHDAAGEWQRKIMPLRQGVVLSDHRPVSAVLQLPSLTQDGDQALLAQLLRTAPVVSGGEAALIHVATGENAAGESAAE